VTPPASRILRLVLGAIVITAVWLSIGVFFASQHHTSLIARGEADDLEERIFGTSISMLAWAIFTPFVLAGAEAIPLRRPQLVRNTILVLLFAVVIATARALLDAWLPAFIQNFTLTFVEYRISVLALFHTHLLFALVLIGIGNFTRLEREETARRHAGAILESQLAEARLRQLSADLQPHFLNNALNGVAALLHRDPDTAEDMLRKLRALLTDSLASGAASEVRLSEELAFVDRYFDIQKMRFGNKLVTAIEVRDERLRDAAVPSLLLQPLVENSVLHGIARQRDGGRITVVVDSENDADGDWLRLQVRDTGPGCDPDTIFARGHLGVPNAQARLVSIYGTKQSFTYSRDADAFVAEVHIPLRMVSG
jgi:two-component system LytT family sensor kinase